MSFIHKERKRNRMEGFDYASPNHYYVTICVKNFELVFGRIVDGRMVLNEYARIADYFWKEIPNHYKNVVLDEFVIMPEHVHGIIEITEPETENDMVNHPNTVGTEYYSIPTVLGATNFYKEKNYGLLSKIIMSYKSIVTKTFRKKFNDYAFKWQRSFYDRIIETDDELENVREYIRRNPENYYRK